MRNRRLLAPVLVSLLIVAVASCSTTTPPNKQALQILDITRASVASSITVFNALISEGKVSEENRQKAIALRTKYLQADKVAVDGLALTISDPTTYTANVVQLANDLLLFINTLKGK